MRGCADKVTEFLQAGMTPEVLGLHGEAIGKGNMRMQRAVAYVGLMCGLLRMAASSFLSVIEGELLLDLLLASAMALLAVLPKRSSTGVKALVLVYSTEFALCIFAIMGSSFLNPGQYAVYVCMMLIIMPMLVTDVYWRVALVSIGSWAIYAATDIAYCLPGVRGINAINSFIALAAGLIFGRYTLNNRAAELVTRDMILDQRDTDPLTGLLTRRSGEERIREILNRGDVASAMIMVDVDNFKGVNDTFGHDYGDKVLVMVAALLRGCFRSSDVLCRLGGDEFMVFVPDIPQDIEWIRGKTDRVLEQLKKTPAPDKKATKISISIGVVQIPKYGVEFNELYRKADYALYHAKRAGKNCCHIFGTELP